MLKGRITPEDDAMVAITLIVKGTRVRREAVVDTGFNGYLSVPRDLVDQSEWYEFGEEEYELATGQIVREAVYIAEVVFDRSRRTVLAVRTEGTDILIGTKLLAGRLCEFDYGSRAVRIRKGNVL